MSPTVNKGDVLINFDNPPVTSVRLAVTFDRLPRLRSAHVGRFWADLSQKMNLPEVDDHYPDRATIESFPRERGVPPFDLSLIGRPRPTQSVLSSADRTISVQLQDDQLALAWSRGRDANTRVYPRYVSMRAQFVEVMAMWERFLRDHSLGSLKARQCEVVYVNELVAGTVWTSPGDLDRAVQMTSLPVPNASLGLPAAEDVHLYQRHVLTRDGTPYGRFQVSADTDVASGDTKICRVQLTYRAAPWGDSVLDALSGLDEGHVLVVRTFAAVTTDEMHQTWGMEQS